jgi:hypothetical protein
MPTRPRALLHLYSSVVTEIRRATNSRSTPDAVEKLRRMVRERRPRPAVYVPQIVVVRPEPKPMPRPVAAEYPEESGSSVRAVSSAFETNRKRH